MKELDLNNWLRYFLSGAIIFSLLYWISNDSSVSNPTLKNFFASLHLDKAVFGISFSLIIGAIVYSLHRAIVYPVIFYFFQLMFALMVKSERKRFSRDAWIPFRPSKIEIDRIKDYWNPIIAHKEYFQRLAEWAAQIHFLYCTSWSLILVQIIVQQLGIKEYYWIIYLFWIILIPTIISHARYWYIHIKLTT